MGPQKPGSSEGGKASGQDANPACCADLVLSNTELSLALLFDFLAALDIVMRLFIFQK